MQVQSFYLLIEQKLITSGYFTLIIKYLAFPFIKTFNN